MEYEFNPSEIGEGIQAFSNAINKMEDILATLTEKATGQKPKTNMKNNNIYQQQPYINISFGLKSTSLAQQFSDITGISDSKDIEFLSAISRAIDFSQAIALVDEDVIESFRLALLEHFIKVFGKKIGMEIDKYAISNSPIEEIPDNEWLPKRG